MRVGAPASPGSDDARCSTRTAPRRGAFAAALALARARAKGPSAPLARLGVPGAARGPGPLTLVRRRCDADEAQGKMSVRRLDAETGGGGPGGHAAGSISTACDDLRRAEGPAGIPLVPPSAVERLAVEAGRLGARSFVDMTFGRDLRIHITHSTRGVELLLTPHPRVHGHAVVELPALVAALRERGVLVARAEVRAAKGGAARSGALTPRRPSATTAAMSHPAGTVAKW